MTQELLDYIGSHTSPEPEVLRQIERRTHLHTVNPRMLSGHVQGRLLSTISRMIRPARVLEMGTFAGYSALCLAEGLQPDGKVITIEKNDEMEDFIRENLALSPLGNQVELHIGGVLEVLETLKSQSADGQFDLVFMDADKREYVEDLQAVLPMVKDGGWILADNTLWDGHIIDPAYDKEKQTIGLRRFNDYVMTMPELKIVMLGIRDGLTIMQKSDKM